MTIAFWIVALSPIIPMLPADVATPPLWALSLVGLAVLGIPIAIIVVVSVLVIRSIKKKNAASEE